MSEEDEFRADEMYHLRCRECLYHKCDADCDGVESVCKRIDHKAIRFYKPWFKSYDCGTYHLICRDFEPHLLRWPLGREVWRGYDDYRALMKEIGESWATGKMKTMWFQLRNDDFKDAYEVDTEDFINGTMIRDGYLMCRKKWYYKTDRTNPVGYKLTAEDTEPVKTG